MTRLCIALMLLLSLFLFMALSGCDKEKIVESTEYIHDVEYVELPPDTIIIVDTVFAGGDTVNSTDTLYMYDTVVQVNYVYDTVETVVVDTITTSECTPNEYLALAALQYYSDPLVFDLIYDEFAIDGGWTFYLSAFQVDITQQSSDVYDIYGYIDYWTEDWSGFHAIEYYWRVSYVSGDPAHPGNWEMSEPPTSAPGLTPGLIVIEDATQSRSSSR